MVFVIALNSVDINNNDKKKKKTKTNKSRDCIMHIQFISRIPGIFDFSASI